MNLEQLLDEMRKNEFFMKNVTYWKHIDKKEAVLSDYPNGISPKLIDVLKHRGIHKLYSHQAEAINKIMDGKDVIIVTPTASGKTLCYNIPVIDSILKNPDTRALYIFPTKALSQDQVVELHDIITVLDEDIKTFTYDGDTSVSARKSIRQAGHIVVTNPDMLHTGILPYHTKWVKLFENLKYIVIDEVHMYRGVFGSHMANVIRRLNRICSFYGSKPQFICCSATIANPSELAGMITGRNFDVIDKSGAPSGDKHVIFYNPPVVNRELGIRKSSVLETRRIASLFIRNKIQTIVFAKSRLLIEVLVTYLKKLVADKLGNTKTVRGYRGGYLPGLRREIEQGLKSGNILGVVSTNALELGVDIGRLEACVICGYPGTVASTWQQAGRAGRRSDTSAAVVVASSNPLDQYIIQHPKYFFDQSPEYGLISPDNLYILISHLKCAAFELPFEDGENFGVETTDEMLKYLEKNGVLRHVAGRWYWMADSFPAENISLRSASNENFIIIDTTGSSPIVIGQMDRFSAPMFLYPKAIYIHDGIQYQVEKLDFENRKAYVSKVNVDYYTDANLSVNIRVLDVYKNDKSTLERYSGEVMVTSMVTLFKKIKFDTHENVGWGHVDLPELEMHTTSYWVTIPDITVKDMTDSDIQSGLVGISNVLSKVASLYLMCDPSDIQVVYQVKSPFTRKPTIFIYDKYPGGIGFSDKLYEIHTELFKKSVELIKDCECIEGCPSCVGPVDEIGHTGKATALKILEGMINDTQSEKKAE